MMGQTQSGGTTEFMGLMQSKTDGDNITMMMHLLAGREHRDSG